ncbi:MAG: DUF423 domain-containing protein [Planctomycetota bacterium]
MSQRLTLIFAAVFGFSAVAIGAFGAHGLEDRVSPARLAVFEVGARYQMVHALALFALAGFVERLGSAGKVAVAAFVVGILIFAGSLYLLVLLDQGWLGAVTPIGGVSLMVGWASVFVGAWRFKAEG